MPPYPLEEIGVSCYELSENTDNQLSLFGDAVARERAVTDAVVEINQRFGARTLVSADTLHTTEFLQAKIPFGSTRYF